MFNFVAKDYHNGIIHENVEKILQLGMESTIEWKPETKGELNEWQTTFYKLKSA